MQVINPDCPWKNEIREITSIEENNWYILQPITKVRDLSNKARMHHKMIIAFLLPFVMMQLKKFDLFLNMSYFS